MTSLTRSRKKTREPRNQRTGEVRTEEVGSATLGGIYDGELI